MIAVWVEQNLNPCHKRVGDCSIRAIANALGTDWEKAYCILAAKGYSSCDVMNADSVIGSVLKDCNFRRSVIPNSCPDCFTAENFCEEYKNGIYVLFFGGHVATVRDGMLFDSWDSSQEIPQYFWGKEK